MNTWEINHVGVAPQRRESQQMRRTACERCRGQKLRCERSSATSEHDRCDRCAKADLDCVITPALPTGRPRLHQDQVKVKTPRPKKRKKETSQTERAQHGDDVQTQLSLPLYDVSTDSLDFPFALQDGFLTSHNHLEEMIATNMMEGPFEVTGAVNDISPLETNHALNGLPTLQTPMNQNIVHGGFQAHSHANASPEPMGDDRRQTLYRLSQLNAALFRHLTDCDIYDPENKYAFLSPNAFPVDNVVGISTAQAPSSKTSSDRLAIGQMLSFLQEFLGILRYFLVSVLAMSAPSVPPQFSGSDGDSHSESDSGSDSDMDLENIHQRISESASNQQTDLSTRSSNPADELDTDTVKPTALGLDYPTMLTLITCYVSLIRLYRNALEKLLTCVQKSTTSPAETHGATTPSTTSHSSQPSSQNLSSPSVPFVLPGLHIDGFTLTNHRTLQIAVFLQVSMDLLRRVERSVAGLAALDSDQVSQSEGNMALLKMMLKQEAITSGLANKQEDLKSSDVGLSSLRSLVKKIKRSVRDNVCLQLEEADFRPALGGFGDMTL